MVVVPTMTPFASVVRTVLGVWYKVVEPLPAMEKYTCALLVEATWKSGRLVVVVAWTAKDANGVVVPMPTRWPPASEMARRSVVEVAHLESYVVPVASVPQLKTPAVDALTSQLAAFKLETMSCVVDARPETARFVVVALVVVVFAKMLPPVKVLVV
jgi:hypothetical protein